MKKSCYYILLLSVINFITSCIPNIPEGNPTPVICDSGNIPILTTTNPVLGSWQGTMQTVSYGVDLNQNMDIYLPANRDLNTKVIVLIHGGAWNTSGNTTKDEMTTKYLPTLKSHFPDAAFYVLEYRLHQLNTTINRFPTQENDIVQALNFISNRSIVDNVSKKVILLGASAGAHLALLTAYKHNTYNSIKAVVAFAAPSDISTLQNNDGTNIGIATSTVANQVIPSITGNDSTLKYNSSPVNFITSTSVPTLFFHGSNDYTVNKSQSDKLNTVLTTKNVKHQYQIFQCENHGFQTANIVAAINLMQTFVNTNVL
jgi:acetyl esterase/lipase